MPIFSLCCISNDLVQQGFKFQTITYKRFEQLGRKDGLVRLGNVILNNMQVTLRNIQECHKNGWAYRISSALFPLLTYDKADVSLYDLPQSFDIIEAMADISIFVKANNFHLSDHPDEFNSLASPNPVTVEKTIKELNFHGWVMDNFGAPRSYNAPVNIHTSCYKEGLEVAANRFCENFMRLDKSVTSRLVIEGEDKPNSWSIRELIESLYPHLLIPITYDSLHQSLNGKGLSNKEAFHLALHTWTDKGFRPHFHYSEGLPNAPRSHAMLPRDKPELFGYTGEIYFDVELKGKDEAIRILEK